MSEQSPKQSLRLLQHWMKTVVTERGGLDEKLDVAAQRHGLRAEDVVSERRGLSARERLAVSTSDLRAGHRSTRSGKVRDRS
jgi:hypothetical protein